MNAIPGPEGWRLLDAPRGKDSVERNEAGGKLAGEFPRHMDFGIEVLPPRDAVRRTGQNERLADDDPDPLAPGAYEDIAVVVFKNVGRSRIIGIVSAPAVVDADEDGDPVRFEVQAIVLPASDEIGRAVSRDALVDGNYSGRLT